MVNTNMLRGSWISRGFNNKEFACEIGVSESTLTRYLHGEGNSIPVGLVTKIIDVLHLSPDEVNAIFFAPNVAFMQQKQKGKLNNEPKRGNRNKG